MTNFLISIDWDHTFRKPQGLDVNLLMLTLYAKGKNIPVGLTTHRDIENTTYYTLYPWQSDPANNKEDALAAAISYWHTHLLTPMNLEFDFINARYQPNHSNNYYQDKLLSLEKELFEEITQKSILSQPHIVRATIQKYISQKELKSPQNECKEMQINWLYKQYANNNPLTIFHIDDDHLVCGELQKRYSNLYGNTAHFDIQTILVSEDFLLDNPFFTDLLTSIGLTQNANQLLEQPTDMEAFLTNMPLLLSAFLFLAQTNYVDKNILVSLAHILESIEDKVTEAFRHCYLFVRTILDLVLKHGRPIHLIANNLQGFYF